MIPCLTAIRVSPHYLHFLSGAGLIHLLVLKGERGHEGVTGMALN